MQDWAVVYEEHVQYVYRFLMYYLGNREDAEDITQETFIKAFNAWGGFDHRSSVRTWLIAIARNLAVDRIRRSQRSRLLQRLFRQEVDPLPDEMFNQEETKREMYAAIQTLKPNYRAVVILRGVQEYSIAEVADILGWSESKVKVTFHRAIKSLSQKWVKREGGLYELV